MDNDIRTLIDSFRGYRDLLSPIQQSLHDFADTYNSMRSDIDRLNTAFQGDIQGNLDKIYKNLSSQAERAQDLSSRIDQFIKLTDKYTDGVNRLAASIGRVEERLNAVNEIEARAEEQISRLDGILEEKRRGYNVKELQRTLEGYNANVQRVSEYINKDIAEAMTQNYKKLESIKTGNDGITKRLADEGAGIDKLIELYRSTDETLKKITQKGDVNEEYIFEILDRWADDRKIKRKK